MSSESTHTKPAEESIEVLYVQAHSRKMRSLWNVMEQNDDLRSCWYPYHRGPVPSWEHAAYYVSKRGLKHSTGVWAPKGTYFILIELTEEKPWVVGGSEEELKPIPIALTGDYMRMTCLDPRDENKTLSFGFWHASQDDQSVNFDKIDNAMMVLAIAGTGLAL